MDFLNICRIAQNDSMYTKFVQINDEMISEIEIFLFGGTIRILYENVYKPSITDTLILPLFSGICIKITKLVPKHCTL